MGSVTCVTPTDGIFLFEKGSMFIEAVKTGNSFKVPKHRWTYPKLVSAKASILGPDHEIFITDLGVITSITFDEHIAELAISPYSSKGFRSSDGNVTMIVKPF
jgi:hypothetical protein